MAYGVDRDPLSVPLPTGGHDGFVHGAVPAPEQVTGTPQTNLVTHEAVENTVSIDNHIELGEN